MRETPKRCFENLEGEIWVEGPGQAVGGRST